MSKLQNLIRELCPNGVEYRKLEEVCNILDYQRKPVSKSKRIPGKYPYYGANGIQDYVDDFLFDGTFVLVGEDGSVINKDYSPILNWATGKIWVNNHAHILSEKTGVMSLRFLYFILSVIDVSAIVRGTPPKLNQTNLRNIEIPVPPIEVQKEIVRILDTFTSHAAELQAELQARLEQYGYYRNKLLCFNAIDDGCTSVTWMNMSEVGEICMCKRIMKDQTNNTGGIPFYKIGTFGKVADAYISRELYEDYKSRFSFPIKGEILISASGTIGRTVVYDGKDAYFQDSNIVWIHNDEAKVLNRYLYHYYQIIEWNVEGGTIKRLYNNNLAKTKIAVPSLAEQERIVSILDKFEALTSDLSLGLPAEIVAVQEQYEYYRNKLLSFQKNKVSA